MNPYLRLYRCDAYTLAKRIMDDIVNHTGISTAYGIGPNLLLAKVALDTEVKQMPTVIAECSYEDVQIKS